VERNIEHEFVPAALELGLGICPWSPLASGLLTGKYRRAQAAVQGEGRLQVVQEMENSPFRKMLDEKNWKIVDELIAVSKQIGRAAGSSCV
jgi:aryl-alcohol dehydrogenase-like predicted oxidoreductase